MSANKRILKIVLPIAIVVVVLAGIGLSVGLTYTLWSDTSGGDTSVAPSITTYDWNAYAKYFTYTAYNSNGDVIATGVRPGDTLSVEADHFSCSGLTVETLMGDVVFPKSVTYHVGEDTFTDDVTEIASTIFSDVTYKAIPTSIYISPTITKVRQDAFAGLTNLQKIVICANSPTDSTGIRFGYHSFGNCTALKEIKCEGQKDVVFTDLAGIGCSSLTTLDKGSCALYYVNNTDTGTAVQISSDHWTANNNYKAKIFPGTPAELNPFPPTP